MSHGEAPVGGGTAPAQVNASAPERVTSHRQQVRLNVSNATIPDAFVAPRLVRFVYDKTPELTLTIEQNGQVVGVPTLCQVRDTQLVTSILPSPASEVSTSL